MQGWSLVCQKIPHFWGSPSAQTLGTGGPQKMGDFLTNQTIELEEVSWDYSFQPLADLPILAGVDTVGINNICIKKTLDHERRGEEPTQ